MTDRTPGKYESLAWMWEDLMNEARRVGLDDDPPVVTAHAKAMFMLGARSFSVALSRIIDLEIRKQVTSKESGQMLLNLRKEAVELSNLASSEWRALGETPKP